LQIEFVSGRGIWQKEHILTLKPGVVSAYIALLMEFHPELFLENDA
jgi:hypothetical protein